MTTLEFAKFLIGKTFKYVAKNGMGLYNKEITVIDYQFFRNSIYLKVKGFIDNNAFIFSSNNTIKKINDFTYEEYNGNTLEYIYYIQKLNKLINLKL